MKKRIKDKLNTGTLFSLILLAVFATMLLKNFPLCRSLIGKAAVLSAKTVLVSADGKVKAEAESETAEKTESVNSTIEETESTTKSPKEDSDKNSEEEENFTAEPEDIKKLIEEYSKNSDKDKKDGAIKELTYTTSGATDSFGNIRLKNTNDTKVNIEKLLGRKADFSIKDKSQPAVLIFHTHTTEAYQILDRSFYSRGYVTRSEDSGRNMIRVGDEICSELEKAGYNVIHDTTIYDRQYNGAYQRSRVTVEEYLKKYPSIQITLDIHRDAIQYNDGTKVKPVNEINGKKCAQMMIISGCQEQGNGIADFPDWEYNLVFALHLQNKLEEMFPGIMRPLYFCPRRYNMNVNHCSLLIEMGSDANTLSEGVYAGKCLGKALAALMDEYVT